MYVLVYCDQGALLLEGAQLLTVALHLRSTVLLSGTAFKEKTVPRRRTAPLEGAQLLKSLRCVCSRIYASKSRNI